MQKHTPDETQKLTVPAHRPIKRSTLSQILKHARLSVDEFTKLLRATSPFAEFPRSQTAHGSTHGARRELPQLLPWSRKTENEQIMELWRSNPDGPRTQAAQLTDRLCQQSMPLPSLPVGEAELAAGPARHGTWNLGPGTA